MESVLTALTHFFCDAAMCESAVWLLSVPIQTDANFWDEALCDRQALLREAVAVTGRLRNHEEARVGSGTVPRLVGQAGGDLDSLAWFENYGTVIELYRQLTFQNIEKLAGALMPVTLLFAPRGHALFDDAEAFGTHEVPAVANFSPDVVV